MSGLKIPLRGVPLGGALGMTLTGCNGAVIGDWMLVERDGQEAFVYEARVEDGGTYEYFYEVVMTVNRNLSGWLTYAYGASYDGGERTYDYNLAWRFPFQARKSSGRYQIVFDDEKGILSCQLTGGAMDCDDEDGGAWSFEAL